MSETDNTQAKPKKQAQAQVRDVFTIGMGTKGARRNLSGTVTVQRSKIPAHVNDAIWEKGADILLRQASQEAEKAQIREYCKAKGIKEEDAPPIARFPFDYARLERDALAAMAKRIEQWYAGDLGRAVQSLNALDRRTMELIEAAARSNYVARKLPVPGADDLERIVQGVFNNPEKVAKYRAEAERQLAQAAQAVQGLADDFADAA